MRKILALFLVVALVPFLTGCRIDGLWGYDDDDVSSVSAYNNIVPVIRVPAANGVLSSLQGTPANSLRCFIKVTSTFLASGWLEMTATVNANEVFFKLPAGTALTADDLELGNGKMQFRFISTKIDGTPAVIDVVAVAITSTTTSTTGTAGTYSYAINIDFSTTTSVSVSFNESSTDTYEATSADFQTFANTETPTSTEGAVATDTYYTITGLAYSTDNTNWTALSQNATSPTDINKTDLQNLYFKVTFSDAITNTATATFSITADNTDTTAKTTITSLGNNANATWAGDAKSVVIQVTASTPLLADGNYTLSLNSFTGVAGAKTLLSKVSAYFIP